MIDYREIAPSPKWAHSIECFWTIPGMVDTTHRVTPDGCADIIFSRSSGAAELNVIGAMTSYRDFALAGQSLIGVRFRPGTWRKHLGIPSDRITDGVLPLECLWGVRARQVLDRIAEAPSIEQCARVFEGFLDAEEDASPIQRVIAWMERCRGLVSLDEVATQAGLSSRQFRRVCLEQTGLTPKLLARILRFRHALSRIGERPGAFAQLALDCGYYDQAHFINEFRGFAGRPPASYVR